MVLTDMRSESCFYFMLMPNQVAPQIRNGTLIRAASHVSKTVLYLKYLESPTSRSHLFGDKTLRVSQSPRMMDDVSLILISEADLVISISWMDLGVS